MGFVKLNLFTIILVTLLITYSCIYDDTKSGVPFGGQDAPYFNNDNDPIFIAEPSDGGDGWGIGDNDDFGNLNLQLSVRLPQTSKAHNGSSEGNAANAAL